ncbi:MAG: hypothetical protein ACI9JE_001448, partial [Candidatus Krumholzibacteriia bacterium]
PVRPGVQVEALQKSLKNLADNIFGVLRVAHALTNIVRHRLVHLAVEPLKCLLASAACQPPPNPVPTITDVPIKTQSCPRLPGQLASVLANSIVETNQQLRQVSDKRVYGTRRMR